MDNGIALDCKDNTELATALHLDGQTAAYLLSSHDMFCEDYGMPLLSDVMDLNDDPRANPSI